jgi:hypothetical protein
LVSRCANQLSHTPFVAIDRTCFRLVSPQAVSHRSRPYAASTVPVGEGRDALSNRDWVFDSALGSYFGLTYGGECPLANQRRAIVKFDL